MNAQIKVQGRYNSKTNLFETKDETFWIDFFNDRIAKVYRKGLVGLIDKEGKIICYPKYDIISNFYNDFAKVGLNGKFGLINKKGEEVISPSFDELTFFTKGLFYFKMEHMYGVIRENGQVLIAPKYETLQLSNNNNLVYFDGENIGLVNQEGLEIPIFKHIKNYSHAILTYPKIFFKDNNYYMGYPLLEYSEGLTTSFQESNGVISYGFINEKFISVIQPQYDWVQPFKNGFASVVKNNKWGVIDRNNNIIIPIMYDSIQIVNNDRIIILLNGKYGVIDASNKIIIPMRYNRLYPTMSGLYITNNTIKWGVIDENENLVLNYEYDGITNGLAVKYINQVSLHSSIPKSTLFFDGYYFNNEGLLRKDNIKISKYLEGQFDFLKNPEMFLPYNIEYENTEQSQSDGYNFYETLNDTYKIVGSVRNKSNVFINIKPWNIQHEYSKGIINVNTYELAVPLSYQEIINNGTNVFIAKRNNLFGVINIKNIEIVPFEYTSIQLNAGVIIASRTNKENSKIETGIYDFKGEILIPFRKAEYLFSDAGALLVRDGLQNRYRIVEKNIKK